MRASLKEIAQKAGVSVATVARALKDRPDVSRKTRNQILRIADELNYRPNTVARGLVTSKSYTIGLIVSDLNNPFFPEMIKGIEAEANRQGYSVILASTAYDPAKERQAIDLFVSRMVDGLIISPTERQEADSAYRALRQEGIPFVFTKAVTRIESDVVMADDEAGAYQAVSHLLALGRQRIAYIGSNQAFAANAERLAGYERALAEYGLARQSPLIVEVDHRSATELKPAVSRLLAAANPDAIFAFADVVAFVVKRLCHDNGVRVPEDVALVGFDDILVASYLDTALTTVAVPKYTIGREAVKLLLRRIDEAAEQESDDSAQSAPTYQCIVLKPELKVRESCGAASHHRAQERATITKDSGK